jgi:hypothetical protein
VRARADARRRLPTDFSKPIHVDLPISHAGAFCYWVEYDGDAPGERVKGREGYFNIDPILRTKARAPVVADGAVTPAPGAGATGTTGADVALPLDALSILTVVSKWMGALPAWRAHFAEAAQRGYTMLHYTPLQARGASDSPYSLRGQHAYDASLFDGGAVPADGGNAAVADVLRVARDEYGLLSLTDVVLNHTASDSPWLREHPEAGGSPGARDMRTAHPRAQATRPQTRRTSRPRSSSTARSSSSLRPSQRRASRRGSPARATSTRSSPRSRSTSSAATSGSSTCSTLRARRRPCAPRSTRATSRNGPARPSRASPSRRSRR